MSAKLFTVHNKADHAEILISGPIGGSFWDDSGMTEKAFLDALKEIPEDKPLTIGINSEGGSVQDGLGIFNAIKRHKGPTTARIDGYAVSIASVIPLAAQRVVSPKSSIWMIHEPWMMAAGNAEDMLKAAAVLEKHAETLASIYEQETGMSAEQVREKMKAETWFRGDEAVAMGFADEADDAQAAFASFDATKFKNCPPEFLKIISGVAGTAPQQGQSAAPVRTDNPSAISAPLVSASGESETAHILSNAELEEYQRTHYEKISSDKKPEGEQPKPAVTTAKKDHNMSEPIAPVAADNSAILNELKAQVEALTNKLNAPAPVAAVAAPHILTGEAKARKDINDREPGKQRFAYMRDNWEKLIASGLPVCPVRNANTTDSALTTDMLASGFITVLQNRIPSLAMFARDFGTDRLKPSAIVQVPIVTAGGTAQENATSFEDTTNFVGTIDNVAVTTARITAGAHITAAELNSGFRMAQWAEAKAGEFANKIQSKVNAVITSSNFTATPITSAEASFTNSELGQAWAAVAKSTVKSIMLSANAYKNFIPANLESFNPLSTGSMPGWDNFQLNTYWTGAEADTYGFACGPSAIAVASGLPLASPNRGATTQAQVITIPGIGLSVELQEWYSTSSKTDWANWECYFGAAKGDGTAGVLIQSA